MIGNVGNANFILHTSPSADMVRLYVNVQFNVRIIKKGKSPPPPKKGGGVRTPKFPIFIYFFLPKLKNDQDTMKHTIST